MSTLQYEQSWSKILQVQDHTKLENLVNTLMIFCETLISDSTYFTILYLIRLLLFLKWYLKFICWIITEIFYSWGGRWLGIVKAVLTQASIVLSQISSILVIFVNSYLLIRHNYCLLKRSFISHNS